MHSSSVHKIIPPVKELEFQAFFYQGILSPNWKCRKELKQGSISLVLGTSTLLFKMPFELFVLMTCLKIPENITKILLSTVKLVPKPRSCIELTEKGHSRLVPF
ncbi:Hypothetical predicted protein [Olea europaea subsp. europaea]|uniref:Uncharacterized protein n=1 Tax=Olea europaea subsp. europaea TaxID=158383 RepID=A0A8S0SA50_OLEEU|nr:Hypothetical predicted protein [Olea europaea subsp. europaea]